MQIRAFAASDHARACALWEATPGIGLSSADSFERIASFLVRNPGLSFVVTEGSELVGTILCGHDGRRGLIHHLAISLTHRRRGLGRQLVAQSLAALRGVGIEKCHLLVFLENAEGRAFWRSIGAEERTSLGVFSMPT
jgi:N-acetylglutamate synthase